MKMNRKMVTTGLTLTLVVGLVLLAADQMVFAPARQLSTQAAQLREKVNTLQAEQRKEKALRSQLQQAADRTFASDEARASEMSRARLSDLLNVSGLGGQRLTLRPVTGLRVAGAYREVGWAISTRGQLSQIVSFMYLLNRDDRLHRLENLTLTPVQQGKGQIDFQCRYLTLVLDAPRGENPPQPSPTVAPLAPPDLSQPDRQWYEVIATRNLFAPFVPPQPAPAHYAHHSDPPADSTAGLSHLRIVGLPTWAGRVDVLVRDHNTSQTRVFHVGDELSPGRIVMVDYRRLPRADRPHLLANSRVILEIQREYWAIDLGATFDQRYKLAPEQLPEPLRLPEMPAMPASPATDHANG